MKQNSLLTLNHETFTHTKTRPSTYRDRIHETRNTNTWHLQFNAHRNVAHLSQVKDRDVIIVDDMIDTANTTCKAARLLRKHGARRVFVFATHGIFTDKAPERIGRSSIEEVRRWRGLGW